MCTGALSDFPRCAILYYFHSILFLHQLKKSSQDDLLLRVDVNMSTGLADNPLLLLWKGMHCKTDVSEESTTL